MGPGLGLISPSGGGRRIEGGGGQHNPERSYGKERRVLFGGGDSLARMEVMMVYEEKDGSRGGERLADLETHLFSIFEFRTQLTVQ